MNVKNHFTTHEYVVVPKKESTKNVVNRLRNHLNQSINYSNLSPYNYNINQDTDENDKDDVDFKADVDDEKDVVSEYINFYPSDYNYSFNYSSKNPIVNTYIRSALQNASKGVYNHNGEIIEITDKSKGQCTWGPSTFYASLGLQGYFWKGSDSNSSNDPETAVDTNLTKKGFEKVWTGNYDDVKQDETGFRNNVLKPGDLVITYGVKEKKDGSEENSSHVAMWTGKEFISDFKQKGMFVYNKERMGTDGSVQVLRLKNPQVEIAQKGMKFESDDDKAYERFLESCPDNIRYTDPKEYRMRRYWELYGKPSDFWSAIDKTNMFNWVEKDKAFHSNSVAQNENGEYEFMKFPNHSTVRMETDWYKLGKVYPEEGEPFLLTPEHGEAYKEWQDFKDNYDLDESGEFFKYVPKKKDVPKDAEGAKIIVIEKEVIKEPEEEKDPLKCLLCQIMNAMGHRHHAFSELRPDKLTDIFGGDSEIVIKLGGPEKAYDEDSFEEMLKDILPIISTSKKYTKDDIKNIRSKKAEHGTSMKRLLSLLDDDKILKAFHGMQLFKGGGEIQSDAKDSQIETMSKITIQIGDNDYQVYEAKTDEQKKTGLKGVTKLQPNEGMIFYWDEPQDTLTMTMVDCEIPLKIVSFDEDLEATKCSICLPNENPIIMPIGTKYVVELHPDSNVKIGDELDLPNNDDDEYVMQVLGSDGSIQMQLKGGERIFSRPNTKILLKWAKQAYNSNNPSDFARLGKLLFKYLDKQDNREPEYVSLDDKNK